MDGSEDGTRLRDGLLLAVGLDDGSKLSEGAPELDGFEDGSILGALLGLMLGASDSVG